MTLFFHFKIKVFILFFLVFYSHSICAFDEKNLQDLLYKFLETKLIVAGILPESGASANSTINSLQQNHVYPTSAQYQSPYFNQTNLNILIDTWTIASSSFSGGQMVYKNPIGENMNMSSYLTQSVFPYISTSLGGYLNPASGTGMSNSYLNFPVMPAN